MKTQSATVILSILVLCFDSCIRKREMTSPVMAPITEAVFASGHIEPKDQFVLTAMNDGYLNKVMVEENDEVRPGQLLFVQDFTNPLIQETAAKQNLAIAKENYEEHSSVINQLKEQIVICREKLGIDSIQYIRIGKLYKTNSVSRSELENAGLAYTNSLNMLKSLEDELQSTRLNLKQTLINSQSQYEVTRTNRNYYNLVSPGHYRVYEIYKKQGELLRKAESVALLGHPDSMLVVMNIDESGIARIRTGLTVLVELNTQKKNIYIAHVSKIYPYFDDPSQSYKVEATFDKSEQNMIAGTLLQANIIVQKKDSVLLIPRAYMSLDKKVLVKHGNTIKPVTIEAGIISTDWVEVLNGLGKKDIIIKP
jgi:multidrug efflux pump subunit AcrA (membrane-fusion protein)